MNDEALREKIRKEIQSLKDGLDTNAVNAAKIAWCEETEDSILHLIAEDREKRETEIRIGERRLMDIEIDRETDMTIKAKAFIKPEGLDGYKCAMRDVHLDNNDRIKALSAALNNKEDK